MSFQKQNYFQRRTKPKGPRTNEKIRADEVQVINNYGENLGTLPTKEAIEIAKREGLDLIELRNFSFWLSGHTKSPYFGNLTCPSFKFSM